MKRSLPRPSGQRRCARLKPETYLRLAMIAERWEKLQVAAPLELREMAGSPVLSFAGGSLRPVLAKITGNDSDPDTYFYSWTEQEFNGTDFNDKSGGLSGTTSTDYALNIIENTATNSDAITNGTIVWITKVSGTDGSTVWLILCPFGYTGTITRYGSVHWDSAANKFTQDIHTEIFRNGLMVYRESPVRLVDITPTSPCGT